MTRFAHRNYGGRKPRKRKTNEERFWEKVEIIEVLGCWRWTAALSNGYGIFNQEDRTTTYGHKFVYELYFGPVPAGMELHHTCDNRTCVQPFHLKPETKEDHARISTVRRVLLRGR